MAKYKFSAQPLKKNIFKSKSTANIKKNKEKENDKPIINVRF